MQQQWFNTKGFLWHLFLTISQLFLYSMQRSHECLHLPHYPHYVVSKKCILSYQPWLVISVIWVPWHTGTSKMQLGHIYIPVGYCMHAWKTSASPAQSLGTWTLPGKHCSHCQQRSGGEIRLLRSMIYHDLGYSRSITHDAKETINNKE